VSGSIGLGIIGYGTVGSGVVALLNEHAELYAKRLGRSIELRRVLVRDASRPREGIDAKLITDAADAFFETAEMPIIIEVAGGTGEVAEYVRRGIKAGKHIVTANKALLAAEGPDLFKLADDHGVAIAFEASCGGGIPIVTALKFGLMANCIDAMYGILNGTCNYILTAMSRHGKSYDDALHEAQEKQFAEADPTLDVSGKDAAQKLAILASIGFGVRVEEDDVACVGIDNIALVDIISAEELGYEIKLLAIAQRRDAGSLSLRTEPCFVSTDEPIAQVHGSFNALSVFGNATGHTMYFGRGAGQMPTASAVVSDLINVASGWYPHAFKTMRLWPDQQVPAQITPPAAARSRFYLRVSAADSPGVMSDLTRSLGASGISISAILQHESDDGAFVPVVITTHEAPAGDVSAAAQKIAALETIEGEPVCIPIMALPEG